MDGCITLFHGVNMGLKHLNSRNYHILWYLVKYILSILTTAENKKALHTRCAANKQADAKCSDQNSPHRPRHTSASGMAENEFTIEF